MSPRIESDGARSGGVHGTSVRLLKRHVFPAGSGATEQNWAGMSPCVRGAGLSRAWLLLGNGSVHVRAGQPLGAPAADSLHVRGSFQAAAARLLQDGNQVEVRGDPEGVTG